MSHSHEERPLIPRAGIVYGDTIYWITIFATVITLIGSVMSFIGTSNHMDPAYVLSSIWQGNKVEDIWIGSVGAAPSGHWYLDVLKTGDGLTAFGIALGVFSVIPAILASAWVLFKQQERLYATLAVIAGLITIYAMV